MNQITDEARAAAMADLKAKVADLCEGLVADAMEQIDHLQLAGVDIVADHAESGENYATPKDFMVAFSNQIKWMFDRHPSFKTRSDTRRINNYYRHMRG